MGAIHIAAMKGDLEEIKYLVEKGGFFFWEDPVPVDTTCEENFNDGRLDCRKGWTALDCAIKYGHLNIVQYLHQKGAKENAYREYTTSTSTYFSTSDAFVKAIMNNQHYDVIEYVAKNIKMSFDSLDYEFMSTYAGKAGLRMMEILVQNNINVCYAKMLFGFLEKIEGADKITDSVNLSTIKWIIQQAILHKAISEIAKDIFPYLKDAEASFCTIILEYIILICSNNDISELIIQASFYGAKDFLEFCHSRKINIFKPSPTYLVAYKYGEANVVAEGKEQPLLMSATLGGQLELIKWLINEHEANLLATTNEGKTSLDLATEVWTALDVAKTKDYNIYDTDGKLIVERRHINQFIVQKLSTYRIIINYLEPLVQKLTTEKISEKKSRLNDDTNSAGQFPQSTSLSLEITYSEIKFGKLLGQGGFGTVHLGEWQNMTVAVKALTATTFTPQIVEDFKKETSIMVNAPHDNVVRLYAIFTQPYYGFVMEYVSGGSLYQVLHSNTELNWASRKVIALDTAYGLSYLHSKEILHRDLKSLNILVTEAGHAKLTDFGLSTVKKATNTSASATAGTLLWMAPELFKRGSKHSEQTDVYSYGVVLSELTTRKVPFEDEDTTNQVLIREWIEKGEHDPIPADCPEPLRLLITDCWNLQASMRPTLPNAIERLRNMVIEGEQVLEYRDNLDTLNTRLKN